MTLPTSGTLTSAQLAEEMYGDSTRSVTIPDADTRALAGKPTGTLVFPDDFYGKSSKYSIAATFATSGSLITGFLRGQYGSLSPTYANVDRVTTTSGAKGQIDVLRSSQDEVTTKHSVELTVVGTYTLAELPFTSLTIPYDGGSITLNKSNATLTVVSGKTTLRWADTGRLSTGTFTLGWT